MGQAVNVYLVPEFNSNALIRVEMALTRYAPDWVQIVHNQAEADLVILHAVGRRDRLMRQAEAIKARGKKYAVIQYCVRGTLNKNTADWWLLWRNAELVWSYYDLPALCREDKTPLGFSFYHAPLGVDKAVFYPEKEIEKEFIILSSGGLYTTESVRECYRAALDVGKQAVHLGPELGVVGLPCYSNLTDLELATLYRRCYYVAGLRRTEGFELPAAEGLLCGVRPILFKAPHYLNWHREWGIFIKEGSRGQVVDDLTTIFKREYRPVTPKELELARELFDWQRILGVFWELLK